MATQQYYQRVTLTSTVLTADVSFGFTAHEYAIENASTTPVYARIDSTGATVSHYPISGGQRRQFANAPAAVIGLARSTASTGSVVVDVLGLQ